MNEPMRQGYTWHAVRCPSCTGGRLCSTGQRRAASAWTEQARREYLDHAQTLQVIEKLLNEHGPGHNDYFLKARHWVGNDIDAASITLDLAVAQEVHPTTPDAEAPRSASTTPR